MPRSDRFERFQNNVTSGGEPKALTYDLEAFFALTSDERSEAETLLLDRVAAEADVKAVETLAVVGCQAAVPVLERFVEDPRGTFRAAVNRALANLTGTDEAVARVASDLETDDGAMQSAISAFDLKRIDSPEAFTGLLAALSSSFLPTRINAFDGLVESLGVPESLTEPHQAPLWRKMLLVLTPFPSAYERGAAELREAFERLKRGESPESIGLVYEPGDDPSLIGRVWASLEPKSEEVDVEAVRALSGHDRQWAEAQIVFKLGERDLRAVRALAELELVEYLPVLLEARDMYESDESFVEPAEAAIRSLRQAEG